MKFKIQPETFEKAIPQEPKCCLFSMEMVNLYPALEFYTDCSSYHNSTPYIDSPMFDHYKQILPKQKASELFDRFDSGEDWQTLLQEFGEVEWEIDAYELS